MKTQKLKLADLSVKSFITVLQSKDNNNIVGGGRNTENTGTGQRPCPCGSVGGCPISI